MYMLNFIYFHICFDFLKGPNGHWGLGARLWWSLSGHGCGSGEAGGGAHVLILSMWRFTVTSNSTSIDL